LLPEKFLTFHFAAFESVQLGKSGWRKNPGPFCRTIELTITPSILGQCPHELLDESARTVVRDIFASRGTDTAIAGWKLARRGPTDDLIYIRMSDFVSIQRSFDLHGSLLAPMGALIFVSWPKNWSESDENRFSIPKS
jgi:hypothetical protein